MLFLKPTILVLTSTYPRWQRDTEPGFVHELCKRLTPDYQVHVVTSHYKGALLREQLEGVNIHRFRYAFPNQERLVYPGGMLTNARLHPWVLLLLPFFFLSQLAMIWGLARKHDVKLIHAHWVVPQGIAAMVLLPVLQKTALV
ncbi:MAG: glycosyltransferase family 4 protein, partial [Gammaproteobacteria bacterium]